uniref:Pectinesterase inhibitor domain-containing protein n=1 Tax=Opuntia streptacantha TaxID=393608 RepID=A0A7C8YVM4_OPUST
MKLYPLLPQTALLITLFLISTTLNHFSLASHNPPSASSTSNTSYIKECCTTATYPDLCFATLASYASEIQTNPKLLSTKSLSVALTAAQSASKTIARLSRLGRRLRPREAAALSECTMAVAHSEIQLQRSLEEVGGPRVSEEPEMVVSDVETWTSAALTYEDACMEEFAAKEMKGNVRIIVRREIWKLCQLTSNALALVHHVLAKELIKKKEHH